MSDYKRIIDKDNYIGLFATHKSVDESLEYAATLMTTFKGPDKIAVLTMFQCLVNTIIAEEDKRDSNRL